jgi:uncharacterized repeat protein (TIGR03987 family)
MILSTVLISLALVFYSIGVWSERMSGRLKPWHTIFFWLGLICDAIGTILMVVLAGRVNLHFHGLTGMASLLLMAVHAVWATAVLVRGDEKAILNFHKFSVLVWTVWLIPYISGVIIGMRR